MAPIRPCTVFYNPLSGGYSRSRLEAALDFLRQRGLAPERCEVTNPETAARAARETCHRERQPLVIVAGGDGTINGVVNGLEPGAATLAVLPFGTANVLARELGITSPEQALEKIVAGVTRPAAVGCFSAGTHRRYFLLMAGIGIDGQVVKGVRPAEKRLLGKGAYLLSALGRLVTWEREMLTVVSGTRQLTCHSVIVCKAARYGGNVILAADAALHVPEFQVVCIGSSSRTGYLRLLGRLLRTGNVDGPGVTTFSAANLEIIGSKPLQADGDYYLETPATLQVVPDFMELIV